MTCNQGLQHRTRICDDPSPKYGGDNCVGSNRDTQSCQMRGCDEGIGIAVHSLHITSIFSLIVSLYYNYKKTAA